MRSHGALAIAIGIGLAGCGSESPVFTDAGRDAPQGDAVACGGLDLADCRRTEGCIADVCPSCNCDLSYRGCLAADTEPAACPDLACPSQRCCRSGADCAGELCVNPDEFRCGGACNPQPGNCAVDADCNADRAGAGGPAICEPIRCACSGAPRACVPGCITSDDCDQGQTCTVATGRCQPTACSAAAPCPLDFDCTAGACQRRSCTSDVACDGYCVEGLCRGGLGECQLPQP